MHKHALRDLTSGDWQVKVSSDIWPSINLHNTPVISVLIRQIFYSHGEYSLFFVIRDWKLSWTWFVCFNCICARWPIISFTQVFYMAYVSGVIATWDRDWSSGFHWYVTDCIYAVNSCNKSKYNILLGCF